MEKLFPAGPDGLQMSEGGKAEISIRELEPSSGLVGGQPPHKSRVSGSQGGFRLCSVRPREQEGECLEAWGLALRPGWAAKHFGLYLPRCWGDGPQILKQVLGMI